MQPLKRTNPGYLAGYEELPGALCFIFLFELRGFLFPLSCALNKSLTCSTGFAGGTPKSSASSSQKFDELTLDGASIYGAI